MLKQATTSVPIVFVQVTDPVRGGFVRSLAHPGGNITGFSSFEYAIVGKWLDLLKDVAPNVSDILVMHDPKSAASSAQSSTMESLASSRGLKLKFAPVRDAADIEKVLGQVASSNTALSVLPDPVTVVNGALIARLANEHHMPAIYPLRFFAAKGGLMSYGNDTLDLHRRAATYVDRILKGEKPENLPVQAPTKFELVINLKTAKIVGLTIPRDLLATADDIIE
jgi:putative ABC transport system substrate-binding protein